MNTRAQRQGYTDFATVYRMQLPADRDYAFGWISAADEKINGLLAAAANHGANA